MQKPIMIQAQEVSATGIIRRTDDLGRIVIPRAIRTRLGIVEGTAFELCPIAEGLLLVPYQPSVSFVDRVHVLKDDLSEMERFDDISNETRENIIKKLDEIVTLVRAERNERSKWV